MSKMKRRDYIKGMALGAAAIAGSRLDAFGQTGHRNTHHEMTGKTAEPLLPAAPADHFPNWPPIATRPATPAVLLTFHGLLDVYYNSGGTNDKLCGVGFHRGGNHHKPKVSIFVNGAPTASESIDIHNPNVRVGKVNAANQPIEPPDVKFLKNNMSDDIRWLIDMQSPLWYPLSTARGSYAARLFIRHGIFFTLDHTCYPLNQVVVFDPPGATQDGMAIIRSLDHPANHIAAAIELGATEKVLLEVNGQTRFYPATPGSTYEIRFSNMCEDLGVPECEFDWRDRRNEEKRNDFHHHRGALNLTPGTTRYSVALAAVPAPGDQCQMPGRNTNEAPCMGAGYGGGNGPA